MADEKKFVKITIDEVNNGFIVRWNGEYQCEDIGVYETVDGLVAEIRKRFPEERTEDYYRDLGQQIFDHVFEGSATYTDGTDTSEIKGNPNTAPLHEYRYRYYLKTGRMNAHSVMESTEERALMLCVRELLELHEPHSLQSIALVPFMIDGKKVK